MPETTVGNSTNSQEPWNAAAVSQTAQDSPAAAAAKASQYRQADIWNGQDSTAAASDLSAVFTQFDSSEPVLSPPRKDVTNAAALKEEAFFGSVPQDEPDNADTPANGVDQFLDKALAQFNNGQSPRLNDTQLAGLKFAYYHPELVPQDPAQSEAIKQIKKLMIPSGDSVVASMAAIALKPDVAAFDRSVRAVFNSNFDDLLVTYAREHNLTQLQQNELRAMHSSSTLPVKDRAFLTGALNALEAQAMAATRTEMGIPDAVPAGWQPVHENSGKAFLQIVQLNYQHQIESNIQDAIRNADPALTDEQISQLRQIIGSPGTSGIPDAITKLAQGIIDKSIGEIREAFGLTKAWAPEGAVLWTGTPEAARGLQYLDEMQQSVDRLVLQVPEGPGKAIVLNIMRMISEALNGLRQAIYASEAEKQDKSKDTQLANKQTYEFQVKKQQEQLEEQKRQQAEIDKQKKKAGDLSLAMKIIGPVVIAVMVVATILSFGTLTPATAAVTTIMIGMMLNDQYNNNFKFMQGACEGMGQLFAMAAEKTGGRKDIATIFGKLMAIMLIAMICMASGNISSPGQAILATTSSTTATTALTVGSMLQFFSASSVSIDVFKAAGMSDQDAALYGMILTIVVQVFAIVCTAASAAKDADKVAKTAESNAAAAQEKLKALEEARNLASARGPLTMSQSFSFRVEEFSLKMTQYFNTQIALMFKEETDEGIHLIEVAQAVMNMSAAGVRMGAASVEAKIDKGMGELELIKAKMKANDVFWSSNLESLQALLKMLQDILNNLVNANASVGETEANMWKKMRESLPA